MSLVVVPLPYLYHLYRLYGTYAICIVVLPRIPFRLFSHGSRAIVPCSMLHVPCTTTYNSRPDEYTTKNNRKNEKKKKTCLLTWNFEWESHSNIKQQRTNPKTDTWMTFMPANITQKLPLLRSNEMPLFMLGWIAIFVYIFYFLIVICSLYMVWYIFWCSRFVLEALYRIIVVTEPRTSFCI